MVDLTLKNDKNMSFTVNCEDNSSSFDAKTASHSLLSASPIPAHNSSSGESAIIDDSINVWFAFFG